MRSPKDMENIQIDITNASINQCSNCTRFCGHHKKPYFMDFETFKKAVDSFDGWDGGVGIIGGEPTLHPEFEKFADYIRQKRLTHEIKLSRQPIADMQKHIFENLIDTNAKLGLWCSLNRGYYRNFETINDTFPKQYLNDHNNQCLHQAILVDRKELGIPDEEFLHRRDNCFVQEVWCATITPKGAFFCEVAGHLDMLFNGPGGWPIEKGWYNRTPDEFGDQLKWCEICGMCLDVPQRISCDGRDDITPGMIQKLKEIGSPKVNQGKYVILNPDEYRKESYKSFKNANDYMEAGGNIRTTKDNKNYYPRSFEYTTKDKFNSFIQEFTPKDWIIIHHNEKQAKKIANYLKDFVLNPGCLYKIKDCILINVLARSIRDKIKNHENLNISKIEQYYPKDKIICIQMQNKIFGIYKKEDRVTIYFLGIKVSIKRKK